MTELLIFDLDNTLLAGDSDRNWGIFLAEQKVVDSSYLDESEKFYDNYYEGSLDIDGFLSFCLRPLIDNDMSYLLKLRQQFIDEKIKPIMTQTGKKLIDESQAEAALVETLHGRSALIQCLCRSKHGIRVWILRWKDS